MLAAMSWSLAVIGFLLSSASLYLADESAPNKQMDTLIGGNTEQTPLPKKHTNKPPGQSILFADCLSGKKQPILPPSFTVTVCLWSARSEMFFQIFDDGTIAANGTGPWQSDRNAILIIEVVAPCMVRIRGAYNKRYLAMEEDGSLVTQTQPDLNSIFRLKVEKGFHTFKRNNYFVEFKKSGQLKKTDRNSKDHRKSRRFVLLLRKQAQPAVYRPTLAFPVTQRATSST